MRLLSIALLFVAMTVAKPHVAAAESKAIRLMTYNLNYGNWDTKGTLDAIAKADVDVVLLQEIPDDWKQLLEKRFKDQYVHQSYRIHTRSAGGLAVLSKLPIKAEELFNASPLVRLGPERHSAAARMVARSRGPTARVAR